MKRAGNRSLFIVICSLLILFVSCQTAPKKTSDPLIDGGSVIPLEPGALIYLFADVPQARPILEFFPMTQLKEKQVQQIIDKTKSAVVGIYPAENERNYQVVGWGNYPAGSGGLALNMSSGWKKQRAVTGYDYWYSQADRLSVAMNASQVFAVLCRTSKSIEPLGAGVPIPDGFSEFRKGSLLALWVADPVPVIETLNLPLQLKVDQVFMSFSNFVSPNQTDKFYEGALRLEMAGVNEARSLMGMLSLARMFALPGSGTGPEALLANPPVLDGKSITLKTPPMNGKDVALLFRLFSL